MHFEFVMRSRVKFIIYIFIYMAKMLLQSKRLFCKHFLLIQLKLTDVHFYRSFFFVDFHFRKLHICK